ncbi:MAG: 3-deoxy-manno-octulosonate cytidylyltransferase [Calditrichae bacterium]|nr:3-deoxy-manno-octulosonate cytidylyltransferase [Calditrichota bacterium]MCB9058829.1 3-deoxy-manno-octulosonate cytidylyltransferase [Calditrichia bacterium]
MKTICVIPARYASSRLPGKPLAEIAGKPMIQWVYEQASKANNIDEVIVATDHTAIKKAVENFNGMAVMTAPELPSGTDRVYAAIKEKSADIVINLQGDEPFISEKILENLVNVFENPEVEIATAVKKIEKEADISNPNVVKVTRASNGFALYFSRSAIPFIRDNRTPGENLSVFYKHIGIYAYRKSCLEKLTELGESNLERSEKLEQLRFLENNYRIFTILTDYESISVDTPDDLKKANSIASQLQNNT